MIGRTLSMAAALFGALISSQAPEFAQQYRQRLGGAVDELAGVVSSFDQDAAAAGIDRTRALTSMISAPETLIRLRGQSMQAAIARYERLRQQLTDFEASGPLGRVESLLESPDTPLIRATYAHYEPAVPTTAAGLITALSGFLVVYFGTGVIRLLFWPLTRLRRRRRRERRQEEPLY